MDLADIQIWTDQNPQLAFGAALVISIVAFFIARGIVAKGLYYLAERTETKYDDILVASLKPFRVAFTAPLFVIYQAGYLLPEFDNVIKQVTILLILWVLVRTFNSLLDALIQIHEQSPSYTGVSIQGYLDIVKILVILVGVILGISILTGESPLVLLSGLGALTAVLLLIFRETILSLVASIQISANDLVKEGDWIEVPSFGADGDVIDITLHEVKIQNFDNTISVIPTYKFTEIGFRNWRGMQESGGRRIKRSIHIDLSTIKFCDEKTLKRLEKIDLIQDYIARKKTEIEKYNQEHDFSGKGLVVNGRQLTNVGIFRAYIVAYLRANQHIHQDKMTFLVRQLAPRPTGLPLEIYVFAKTVVWTEYENIQADIFDHLLASVSTFDLRVFQEPTGFDFQLAK